MIDENRNPWKTLSAVEKYDNKWINVTEYQVINPSGGTGIYGKIHYKNFGIGILALDKDLNTWLVGQYRYAIGEYAWEIPEGGGPVELDPLESAKRELLEETGLKANNWTLLLEMHLSNSVTNEYSYTYLAQDLEQGECEPEETEELQLKKIPFSEVFKMVMLGEITDSITVGAVLKAKVWLDEGKIR